MFDPALASQSFDAALKMLSEHVRNVLPRARHGQEVSSVRRQVFSNEPTVLPLFKLFLTNSQNRAQGIPLGHQHLEILREMLHGWDYGRVHRDHGGNPAKLCAAFRARGSSLISGNLRHHATALADPDGHRRNAWVRFAETVIAGAALFVDVDEATGAKAETGCLLRGLCHPVDLTRVPLADLTVDMLWRATDRLVRIPNVGRQLALNFLKDAGLSHCAKPDIHLRRIAGHAFAADPAPYPNTDAGERAAVAAVIAFAQAMSAHGDDISVAAVDRLIWLAGAGRVYVEPSFGDIRLPRGHRARERGAAVAEVLRRGLRPPAVAAPPAVPAANPQQALIDSLERNRRRKRNDGSLFRISRKYGIRTVAEWDKANRSASVKTSIDGKRGAMLFDYLRARRAWVEQLVGERLEWTAAGSGAGTCSILAVRREPEGRRAPTPWMEWNLKVLDSAVFHLAEVFESESGS